LFAGAPERLIRKARGMKQYAGLKAWAVLAALAILGVAGMAEADIVVYVKKENRVVPLKVTKYSEYGRDVYVYRPSGASKAIPKSKICAIVNDGQGPYVHILNRCAFTPKQLAKIKKVQEIVRRRKEAVRQAKEEKRKALEVRIKAVEDAYQRGWEAAREAEMDKTWLAAEATLDQDDALKLGQEHIRDRNLPAAERAYARYKLLEKKVKRAWEIAKAEEPKAFLAWITAYNRNYPWARKTRRKDWVANIRKQMKRNDWKIQAEAEKQLVNKKGATRKAQDEIDLSREVDRSIRDYCQGLVGDSYALMEACVQQEKQARQNLGSQMTDPKIMSHCKGIVGDSYSLMEACIRQEEEAKRRLGY